MRIFLTSDVHTERADVQMAAPSGTDVVVLAGDIGEGTNGMKWARRMFGSLPIVYVAGNHEFYDGDIGDTLLGLRRCAKTNGIHFLERGSCVIGNVRFLGATLWTDLGQWHPNAVESALRYSNDYHYIGAERWWQSRRNRRHADRQMAKLKGCPWSTLPLGRDGRTPFHPVIAAFLHRQTVRWLNTTLATAHAGPTVVVSHHAPSYRMFVHQGWRDFSCNPAKWGARSERTYVAACYASDLTETIARHGNRIAAWLHGHFHPSVDYTYRGVRIVSNPRGYPNLVVPGKGDGAGFSGAKIVQVESDAGAMSDQSGSEGSHYD